MLHSGSLNAFRMLSLFRVLELVRAFKGLNMVMTGLLNSLSSVFWLIVLLCLYLFIMGLLGMIVSRAWSYKYPRHISQYVVSDPSLLIILSTYNLAFITCCI